MGGVQVCVGGVTVVVQVQQLVCICQGKNLTACARYGAVKVKT